MILALVLAWGKDVESGVMAVLLVLFIISAAAAWTSIGLALSTWVPNLGRAVTLAVTIYTLIALAWPILAWTIFWGQPLGAGLREISPFYGVFDLTMSVELSNFARPTLGWLLVWIVFQMVVAIGLLIATLATFDRCLGRVRETRVRRARAESPSGHWRSTEKAGSGCDQGRGPDPPSSIGIGRGRAD